MVPDVIETLTEPEVKAPTTPVGPKPDIFNDREDIYFNDSDEYAIPPHPSPKKPNNHSLMEITLLRGDLKLKELIKSPALLAGIFGGLLLGLVTALLLLIYIIYRVRQRKYHAAMKYDLDTNIKNVR